MRVHILTITLYHIKTFIILYSKGQAYLQRQVISILGHGRLYLFQDTDSFHPQQFSGSRALHKHRSFQTAPGFYILSRDPVRGSRSIGLPAISQYLTAANQRSDQRPYIISDNLDLAWIEDQDLSSLVFSIFIGTKDRDSPNQTLHIFDIQISILLFRRSQG